MYIYIMTLTMLIPRWRWYTRYIYIYSYIYSWGKNYCGKHCFVVVAPKAICDLISKFFNMRSININHEINGSLFKFWEWFPVQH